MKNKILVFGSKGLLGKEIRNIKNKNFNFIFFSKEQIDITNYQNLKSKIEKYKPKYLINCAALTDVDYCEKNKKKAMSINAIGPSNLSKISKKNNILLIHISTDYVFNKNKKIKLSEKNKTNPISVYGKSKLIGEKNIIKNTDKYIIIRTSWLYGDSQNNFLKKIYKYSKKNKFIRIIDDQYSIPTYVRNLANTIVMILIKVDNGLTKYNGIYHFSDSGSPISRYTFAKSYFKINSPPHKFKILKISSKNYYKHNIRPYNSSLSCLKITKKFNIKTFNWKKSLIKFAEMKSL